MFVRLKNARAKGPSGFVWYVFGRMIPFICGCYWVMGVWHWEGMRR